MKKMHPVAVLIERVKAEENCTDADLVRRAKDFNQPISKSRWSQIVNDPIKYVSADQIATLTAALQRPAAMVVAAYLEALGYPLPPGSRVPLEVAIADDDRLSPDDRSHLLALLRSLLKARQRRTTKHAGTIDADEDLEDTKQPTELDTVLARGRRESQTTGAPNEEETGRTL